VRGDTPAGVRSDVRELTLLFQISRILDESLDLREVVGPVLEALRNRLGVRIGVLSLLNRETGEISIEAALGLSEPQRERGRYKIGEGIIGSVIETGQPVVVPNVADEPLFLNRTGAIDAAQAAEESFTCVPIKLGNQVVGALATGRLTDPTASEDIVRLLSIVASMIAQAVKLRQAAEEQRQRLAAENDRLRGELQSRFRPANIVGNSEAMRAVYRLIEQVAGSEATVLIRGETGTGKDLVAHAIHYNSPRAERPFVKVNIAALPDSVIESELFGHERGAFTGAVASRKGRFELAHGGTIFLDEIGDLTPHMQVKLLRVLQEREFERVGGITTMRSDVRVIAATNRNLEELLDQELFRADLYYRLAVFPVHIPPLRERKSDIMQIADHFVERYGVRRISTPAIDMLMSYHWPGNVRELENCIERAVLLSNDEVIHGHHLPPTLQTAEASGTTPNGSLRGTVNAIERELIQDALKWAKGNMARAARSLQISERIMGLRVRKHRIDPAAYKS
jgi:Nif-specific regulatory protein